MAIRLRGRSGARAERAGGAAARLAAAAALATLAALAMAATPETPATPETLPKPDAAPAAAAWQPPEPALIDRARRLLREVPLIDGHNDLPWQLRERFHDQLGKLDLRRDASDLRPPLHTDIPRLRRGGVGGQFWSVYVPVELAGPAAVQAVLEQIDVVHRLAELYPDTFELAAGADDVVRIHRAGRIASLIGVEGGHSIGDSLAVLRELYRAGSARVERELAAWSAAHPAPHATLAQVADHLDHVRRVAGIDHVGLGSDFDGTTSLPDGLGDVAQYPVLLAELLRRGYSDDDVKKVAGANLLRVLREAERVAARLRAERPPSDARIEDLDGGASRP